MTASRGLFTPRVEPPKRSYGRAHAALLLVLAQVASTKLHYNKLVQRARNLQARLIVDALYGRYQYQVVHELTSQSFGYWLLAHRRYPDTYMRMGPETVLELFSGVFEEALSDTKYRFFDQQDVRYDWLTPLVQVYINNKITENHFRILVINTTVAVPGYNQALPSLEFKCDLVPREFPPSN